MQRLQVRVFGARERRIALEHRAHGDLVTLIDSDQKRPRVAAPQGLVEIGRPLPAVPLWLADNLAVPLELEESYEQSCGILNIP